ncbi:DUF4365 domain-containing protein [Curtobacterium sp. MCBD17_021]|uniref:DUF4365 domain-containing protein n=1 Tax=Curtobacterium sp. MCBD17_021 TaxID=2175665 RepID=UPI000DA9387C|nr:DUF4365 domain-containing protein [Curtobacterium sp. MCBD17_021]PZE64244.1 hypothetical protein DEI83_11920 [Curtobacterium sp. MCBD17_021]
MTVIAGALEQGVDVVRGLPQRRTDFMEQFQEATIRAIAAAAGCSVSVVPVDDGIDVHLRYRARPGDSTVPLDLQLKSTTSGWNGTRTAISASLSRRRYDEMRAVGTMLPQIVVIMDLPSDPAAWMWSRSPYTVLRHNCYWVSLEGAPAASVNNVKVSAPSDNVFDDEALCRMMARLRGGGRP